MAAWGEQLMALHLGYESVEPWPLRRVEKAPSPQPLSRKRARGDKTPPES